MYKASSSSGPRTCVPLPLLHCRFPSPSHLLHTFLLLSSCSDSPNAYSSASSTPKSFNCLTPTNSLSSPKHSSDESADDCDMEEICRVSFLKRGSRRADSSLTPPSTPATPQFEQQLEFMQHAWRSFSETASGEADLSIIHFRSSRDSSKLPEGFVPFDLDTFLAHRILHELNIDPKYALF